MELIPQTFFNLEKTLFKPLFKDCAYVWMALNHISSYLHHLGLGKVECHIPQGVTLVNPHLIFIGQGTVVEEGAYIQGPCWIGRECQIRHGAYIRGNVLLADQTIVGHTTEIKNSVLLEKAAAAHFAYVGDSLLGSRVNLGAGVKCANFRLDHRPIHVTIDQLKMQTGLKKMGAVIGDDSQIGCNAVLNPGTLLGKEVFCHPLLNIGGVIAEKQVIAPSSPSWLVKPGKAAL